MADFGKKPPFRRCPMTGLPGLFSKGGGCSQGAPQGSNRMGQPSTSWAFNSPEVEAEGSEAFTQTETSPLLPSVLPSPPTSA